MLLETPITPKGVSQFPKTAQSCCRSLPVLLPSWYSCYCQDYGYECLNPQEAKTSSPLRQMKDSSLQYQVKQVNVPSLPYQAKHSIFAHTHHGPDLDRGRVEQEICYAFGSSSCCHGSWCRSQQVAVSYPDPLVLACRPSRHGGASLLGVAARARHGRNWGCRCLHSPDHLRLPVVQAGPYVVDGHGIHRDDARLVRCDSLRVAEAVVVIREHYATKELARRLVGDRGGTAGIYRRLPHSDHHRRSRPYR